MMNNIVRVLRFRRIAFAASVTISLYSFSTGAQNPAAATAPTPTGEAVAERVVITGSNIPTAEEVTASPVDTITPQEINRTGSQEVLNVLQKRNPDFTGGGNLGVTNANISSGITYGGSTIAIRGFPTLVLYEGRRIADSAAISAGGAQFSDVALFPAALISRIEVLKDGASALYGSEAVGGVVNIFTKDDFQGAEVGFRYGTTLEGAVAERRGYAIGGVGNGTTQITAGMQYYEIDPLFERQRDYSNPLVGQTTNYGGSAISFPPNAPPAFYNAIGEDPINYPGPVIANSPFDVGVAPHSLAPGSTFADIPQYYKTVTQTQAANFNLANAPTSTLDTARTNVIASIDHQVFGKQLELFGNFLYSNSDYQNVLNAQPLNTASTVVILGSVRVDPITGAFVPENRGAPAQFNPFQETLDAFDPNIIANRYTFKPRIFDNTNNFYRFLGGIRSQITPDWTAETAAYYSKYDISYINRNLVNAQQLNAMIAGTAVDNSGNPIPALDFFAFNPIGTGPGQVTSAQFNTIYGSNLRSLSSFQRVFDGKLIGFPFELPAGKIGLAVGAEARQEGFKAADSPEIFVGSVPIADISVKRDIYSAYAELQIPIVSDKMKLPLVYSLDLNLAGRYDHYDGVSEDAKVPKVGLRYQPIKDLTLRATYSNSFVAPTLFQTQGPTTTGFSSQISINGQPSGQAQVLGGSNPTLVPAKAESYTAGLVYSPHFIPGLTITADYFKILEEDIVSTLGGPLILTSVNNLGTASPYFNQVAFNNFPGQVGARPVTGPGQLQGNLTHVFYIDNLQNIGAAHNQGFDLSLNYTLDLQNFGQFQLGVNSIVYTQYDIKSTPKDIYHTVLGTDDIEGVGIIPDYKLTFLGEYRWQGFTASLLANYIPKVFNSVGRSPLTEDITTFKEVQDYVEFDGRLSYTFERKGDMSSAAAVADTKDAKSVRDGKDKNPAPVAGASLSVLDRLLNGTTVAVGCNNIFDRIPPFVEQGNSNTDLSVYDGYGRFLYFEIAKKF